MLAGAYDESASYVGDALYRHARTTFALSIIPDGITMTMTAITIARRDRKRPALAALGWQHTHTSARRVVRQLGKLLTNNTASGITIRGVVVVSDPIAESFVLFAHNHPWDSGWDPARNASRPVGKTGAIIVAYDVHIHEKNGQKTSKYPIKVLLYIDRHLLYGSDLQFVASKL